MNDTKRAGGARDGAWPPLRRIRDRVVSDWYSTAATKRENNRRRRAADRVAVREAVSEEEAERSIETAEAADGRAAEGAARHPTGMSGDRGK